MQKRISLPHLYPPLPMGGKEIRKSYLLFPPPPLEGGRSKEGVGILPNTTKGYWATLNPTWFRVGHLNLFRIWDLGFVI